MTQVFVVTEGRYSDYHIVAVFSTKEKADEFVAQYNKHLNPNSDDIAKIEEYELDHYTPFAWVTYVEMREDGSIVYCGVIKRDIIDSTTAYTGGVRFFVREPATNTKYLTCYVSTEDKEKAIKVTNEKRTIILAHNAWGNDALVRELGI